MAIQVLQIWHKDRSAFAQVLGGLLFVPARVKRSSREAAIVAAIIKVVYGVVPEITLRDVDEPRPMRARTAIDLIAAFGFFLRLFVPKYVTGSVVAACMPDWLLEQARGNGKPFDVEGYCNDRKKQARTVLADTPLISEGVIIGYGAALEAVQLAAELS